MTVESTEKTGGDRAECPAPPGGSKTPELVLEAAKGWRILNLTELWRYRELIFLLAWRDIKVRYKQTVLGAAWAVLQPALMMVIFTVFFSRLATVSSGKLPYAVFVYSGLLPWSFFASAISNAANSVVDSERLVTKVYFPRLAIPFAAMGAALLDFAVASGFLVVLLMVYRVEPTVNLLLVPVAVGLLLLAAVGVGTLLAALNVAYRDFRYVIPFLVQAWMFATPSIYTDLDGPGEKPSWLWWALELNPLTGLVTFFRKATLGGPLPVPSLFIAAAVVGAVFLAGCLYFRRVEDSFADII